MPIDANYPPSRIVLCEDADCSTVICHQKYEREFADFSTVLVVDSVDTQTQRVAQVPDRLNNSVNGQHLLYVLFTSGSTGNPKVLIEHHNVTSLIMGLKDVKLGRGSVLQNAPGMMPPRSKCGVRS